MIGCGVFLDTYGYFSVLKYFVRFFASQICFLLKALHMIPQTGGCDDVPWGTVLTHVLLDNCVGTTAVHSIPVRVVQIWRIVFLASHTTGGDCMSYL